MNIPEEITITLNKDKFNDHLNEDKKIILKRQGKKHSGRANLNYIKWYEYQLPSDIDNYIEEINCYDNIAISFFTITPECKENAEQNIIKNGVSKIDCSVPHVDGNTGNIHPGTDYAEDPKNKNYQIVLCDGPGPNIYNKNFNNNLYPANENLYHSKELYVHKASYYPLIYDEEELHDDIRYLFLKEIWEKLNNELKNQNDDNFEKS